MYKKLLSAVLLLVLLSGCASGVMNAQPSLSNSQLPSASVSESVSIPPSPSPSVLASPSPSPIPISDQLDAMFEDDLFFSGSVLVAKDGEVLLSKGYGMADNEKQIPNTTETIFPLGSVTKQFTAMAVMQLYEKGLLDIHDTLAKYLPDFPRGDNITLFQLLTHTSGIVDYINENQEELNALPLDEFTEENCIKLVENKPLNFEPGEKFSYSNTGYLILGYIVEKVSGLSYEDYMRQNIFEPLGMKNTGVVYKDGHQTFSTVGYNKKTIVSSGILEVSGKEYDSEKVYKGAYGAGCLCSTVGDLYLWTESLNTEKLLSKKYMDMIFTPYVTYQVTQNYGFGWFSQTEGKYGVSWFHNGAIPGFVSVIHRFVDQGVTLIIVSNQEQVSMSGFERKTIMAVAGA